MELTTGKHLYMCVYTSNVIAPTFSTRTAISHAHLTVEGAKSTCKKKTKSTTLFLSRGEGGGGRSDLLSQTAGGRSSEEPPQAARELILPSMEEEGLLMIVLSPMHSVFCLSCVIQNKTRIRTRTRHRNRTRTKTRQASAPSLSILGLSLFCVCLSLFDPPYPLILFLTKRKPCLFFLPLSLSITVLAPKTQRQDKN
jgi:hypothetical protein